MPNIPDYTSEQAFKGLQPTAMGVDAYEQSGRSIASSFNKIGNAISSVADAYERHAEMADTAAIASDGTKEFADLTASQNTAFSDADPNDTEVSQKWRDEQLEPALEKIGANAISQKGQEAAQRVRDSLREQFTKSSIGAQQAHDGASVVTSITESADRLSDATYNNPASLEGALQMYDLALSGQLHAHGLTAQQEAQIRSGKAGELRNEIVKGAIDGSITKNPSQFLADLQSGKYNSYLSGPEIAQATKSAEGAVKLQGEQVKAHVEEIRKEQKDQADTAAKAVTTTMVRDDGSLGVPKDYYQNIVKLSMMPGADAGLIRSMVDMGRSITREQAEGAPVVSDPHTYDDFRNRVSLPGADPRALTDTEIVQARADGKLSDKDYNFYKGALATINRDPAYRSANDQFNTFLRGIKSSITKSNVLMGSNDPTGDQKYLQFNQMARDAFEKAYHTGQDWHALLDRAKPNSLWHQAVPYMTDIKSSQGDLMNRVQGSTGLVPQVSTPKRNAGESAADYLKRTGGQQ